MINSSVYTYTSNVNLDILEQSEILNSLAPKADNLQIQKSSLTYFLQSYLFELMQKKQKSTQEKNLCCRQLGKNIGLKIAEILSENSFDKFISKDGKVVKYIHEVKFLCQKVWVQLFGKKIDKLQYAGATSTFTFQDNSFRLIKHISHPQYQVEQQFIALNFELTCGIIQGVVNRFGHQAQVKYQDKAHSQFELRFKTPGDTSYFSTY